MNTRMLQKYGDQLVDDDRIFINAVLYIARSNAPWHFLPPRYGHFENVLVRLRRWRVQRRWSIIFSIVNVAPEDQFFALSEGHSYEDFGVNL